VAATAGLLLPDGTLWKKVGPWVATSPIPGDYDDSSHPGCVRRILPTGDVQGEDPPGLLTPGSRYVLLFNLSRFQKLCATGRPPNLL
jgi:hypothetical protein